MALVTLTEQVARPVVEALLNGLWQGVMLAALIWSLLRVLPRINATTRYAVWWVTLIAVICLPVAAGLAPLRAAKSDTAVAPRLRQDAPSRLAHSFEADSRTSALQPRLSDARPQAEAAAEEASAEDASPEEASTALSVFPIRLPARAAILLFALWLLIALVMMARVAVSYRSLRRLKRNCSPLPACHQENLERWLAHLRLTRPVRLCGSDQVTVPMAFGLRNPVILIPHSLAEALSAEEFEQVLLHEMAHVRRRDDWMKLAQRLIEAILFFHPAVMMIGRRLDLEREIACDDSVISLTGRTRPYAACLIRLAELTSLDKSPLLAPGAVTIKRQISSRVEMIVDKRRNATLTLSKAGLFIILTALALACAEAAHISPVLAVASSSGSGLTASAEESIKVVAASREGGANGSESLTGRVTDSLTQAGDESDGVEVEAPPSESTEATQPLSAREPLLSYAKPAQGSIGEPPHPPVPPIPPGPPPVPPSPPASVPSPPSLPADQSSAARAAYDQAMAEYNRAIEKYREQIRGYDQEIAKYREGMREYDRQMDRYNEEIRQYNEEMDRYRKEMSEYEKRVLALVPGAVLNIIAQEVGAVDVRLDAAGSDKLERGLRSIADQLAIELTQKVKDLKINRPEGHITLVSFLSTGTLRNMLRELLMRLDIALDETARARLGVAADRAAPALQSLVVYRWPL